MRKVALALACCIYAGDGRRSISGHVTDGAATASASSAVTWDSHSAPGPLTCLAKLLLSFNACQGPHVGCQRSDLYSDRWPVASRIVQHSGRSHYASMGETGADSTKHDVRFRTTAGDFTVHLDSGLSPEGVARFLDLVDSDFFEDQLFYRVIPGFLIQFGVAADPLKQHLWDKSMPYLPDEPNREQFRAGSVSFAGKGPGSRSCHLFVALDPHGAKLGDSPWETVLGHIDDEGLKTMAKICENHKVASRGEDTGRLQGRLVAMGNQAAEDFPDLDRVLSVEVLSPGS